MVRVLSAEDYISVSRPQLTWLIPSYVPYPGIVLLIGEPKAGKSFLGLQVAMCIASGTPFLGQPVAAASVLYLQLDTSETVWRQRLTDLRSSGAHLHPNLHFVHPDDQPTRVNILSSETRQFLHQAMNECEPKLVVIDVLRELHSGDEQDSTAMKLVGDAIASTFQGRTVLLIHHTHKLYEGYGAPNPMNAARGSSYTSGKADAIWLLHGTVLTIVSRFHHTEKHALKWESNGLWSFPQLRSAPRH